MRICFIQTSNGSFEFRVNCVYMCVCVWHICHIRPSTLAYHWLVGWPCPYGHVAYTNMYVCMQ